MNGELIKREMIIIKKSSVSPLLADEHIGSLLRGECMFGSGTDVRTPRICFLQLGGRLVKRPYNE